MSNVKQVICVRKDLKMRKGKIAAQCAHASLKVFLDQGSFETQDKFTSNEKKIISIPLSDDMNTWLEGNYTKICVSVDSEQELLQIYQKAKDANILCSLITDLGLTEFKGVPTKTVVAIGPAKSEVLDPITKELKLL